MNKDEYQTYLESEHWQEFSGRIRTRRERCEKCGITNEAACRKYRQRLNVHHKTYTRIGREKDSEMQDTEQIYQAYPRHRDKRFALLSIEKAIQRIMAGEAEGVPLTRQGATLYLLQRTTAFAQSFAGQRGQLTPYPATWMNRGGYMDDPAEWEYITPDEEKRLARNVEANVGVSSWRPQ